MCPGQWPLCRDSSSSVVSGTRLPNGRLPWPASREPPDCHAASVCQPGRSIAAPSARKLGAL
eukprot:5399422-Prymnesium_polylepis.1